MIITKSQQYILFDCREPNLILDNLPVQIKNKIEKIQKINNEVGTPIFWSNSSSQFNTLEKNTLYLLYSKPGQIGYELPGAISPKDWCSSKTLPLKNNTECNNVCNDKCCEEPDWICCGDGIHCAETINDCPQLSNIESDSFEIANKTIELSDYFNTSLKPITLCYSNTNNKLIIPEYKGYNLAVYFDADGNQTSQQQIVPGQYLNFKSTIVLGSSDNNNNDNDDIKPSPPTIISVESGSGTVEYPASTIVKIEPEKKYDLTQNADSYVFRFNGVAMQPTRIGPAPAIQDCCPELEANTYEFSGDYTGQFVTTASVNSSGTGSYSFPKLMGLGTCFISDGTIFASGDESGCGEYATDKGLEYEWQQTEAPRNGSWCTGLIACDGRFYINGCTSGSFEDWIEGEESNSVQNFQEGKLCNEISCIEREPPECGAPGCECEVCESCNNGKCFSYCDSNGQICCNDGVTCCLNSVCCATGCCEPGECCNVDEFGQEYCGTCSCTGGKACPFGQNCCMGVCTYKTCCMDVFGPLETCSPSNCEACVIDISGAPVCEPQCDQDKCCKIPGSGDPGVYTCADSGCCTGGDSECGSCEQCIDGACIYQCDTCERCQTTPDGNTPTLIWNCVPFTANNPCESCNSGTTTRCGQDSDGTPNCEKCLPNLNDDLEPDPSLGYTCYAPDCFALGQKCCDGVCRECCDDSDCVADCAECESGFCKSICTGCQKCENNVCVDGCDEGQCCIKRPGQGGGVEEYTCEDCTSCDSNNGNNDCSYFQGEQFMSGYCCDGACQSMPCCESYEFYSECLGQCINMVEQCDNDMLPGATYWDEGCCCCKCTPGNEEEECVGKQIMDPDTCKCKCPSGTQESCESAGLIFDGTNCQCCTKWCTAEDVEDPIEVDCTKEGCLCLPLDAGQQFCPPLQGPDLIPIETWDPDLCQCVCSKRLCKQYICFGEVADRPCKLPDYGWNLISKTAGEYCYERKRLVNNDEDCQPILICGVCPEGWEETPAWDPDYPEIIGDEVIIPGVVGGCCPPWAPFNSDSRMCLGSTPAGTMGGIMTQVATSCPCHPSKCP